LGYFGWHGEYDLAAPAMADESIASQVKAVMDATNEALIRRHGFDPEEQRAVAADLQERFKNEALGDTCFRLARDPVRKLAHDDRLVGAARLCEAEGIDPSPLAAVIRAALTFSDERDATAVELQQRIADEGIGAVLEAVSGIRADEPLGKLILENS
jgi:mannitol-1-phosphate 5-dehydrogenase